MTNTLRQAALAGWFAGCWFGLGFPGSWHNPYVAASVLLVGVALTIVLWVGTRRGDGT